MKIDYIPCDERNYCTSTRSLNSIKYIVIHYTANNGDTARNNGEYFGREYVGASANYFVDSKEIIQSVLDKHIAWHCGGKLDINTNRCLKCGKEQRDFLKKHPLNLSASVNDLSVLTL